MGSGAASSGVRTFLIADVRGYTSFTQTRGDEAGARLAARFAAVARAVVEEQGGQLLELRGDEALCVFDSPRGALRAAIAAQRRFAAETRADPNIPLRVGIGIDAGEVVPVEGGYRGGALNLAARLCGQAQAGEVLISEGVAHLARRIEGIEYEPRGRLKMKGMPEAVSVLRAGFELDLPPAEAPPRGRRSLTAVIAAIALVGIVVGLLVWRGRSEAPVHLAGDAVGALDPSSGRLRVQASIGGPPGGIVVGGGSIWVSDPVEGVLRRIDPSTGSVSDTVGSVGTQPTALAFGDSSVWVVDEDGRAVRRVDPDTGVVAPAIGVGNGPSAVAFGAGAAWVLNRIDGTVSRIDPDRSEVTDVVPVGGDPAAIAVSKNSVWVAIRSSRALLRIDPATRTVVASFDVGNDPSALTVSGDSVWVANAADRTLSRIRPTTGEAETVSVGDAPAALTEVAGAVWAALPEAGAVARIDARTGSVARFEAGGAPSAIAGFDGEIWVAAGAPTGSHRGGVLRLVRATDVRSLDPAVFAGDVMSILSITNDGLVAFRRTGGPAGAELVPNLAVALPQPTDQGRTWTFTIRSGIRYSDGTPVRASDVRHGLERSLALAMRPLDLAYYAFGNINGAADCLQRPGSTCDLSAGIEVDDGAGRITFHLIEPDPAFLNLLALPLAYPVPTSIPADEILQGTAPPATGPYRIETYEPGTLKLVRNSDFRAWSTDAKPDGYPDEIVWTTEPELRRRIELVQAGDADGFSIWRWEEAHVRLDRRTLDLLAFGPWDAHAFSTLSVDFYAMQSDLPPVDDERIRSAINLAIDRGLLASRLGLALPGTVSCQGIPPNMIGYRPYCPFTTEPNPSGLWSGPDLPRARQLVQEAGARGQMVRVSMGSPLHLDQAEYLVGLLRRIGLRSEIVTGSVRAHVDATGFAYDYPSPYDALGLAVNCDLHLLGFCDRKIEADVRQAAELEATDPSAAAELWASIDRRLTNQARIAPIATGQGIDLVADFVGNYQHHPLWGMLVDQLQIK
jgi:ABC-type transport system substrate-binding protein/class 3 adenylate cyclase